MENSIYFFRLMPSLSHHPSQNWPSLSFIQANFTPCYRWNHVLSPQLRSSGHHSHHKGFRQSGCVHFYCITLPKQSAVLLFREKTFMMIRQFSLARQPTLISRTMHLAGWEATDSTDALIQVIIISIILKYVNCSQ